MRFVLSHFHCHFWSVVLIASYFYLPTTATARATATTTTTMVAMTAMVMVTATVAMVVMASQQRQQQHQLQVGHNSYNNDGSSRVANATVIVTAPAVRE
jgi:hypothetical protein